MWQAPLERPRGSSSAASPSSQFPEQSSCGHLHGDRYEHEWSCRWGHERFYQILPFSMCHMRPMKPFVFIHQLCLLNLAAVDELWPGKFTEVHNRYDALSRLNKIRQNKDIGHDALIDSVGLREENTIYFRVLLGVLELFGGPGHPARQRQLLPVLTLMKSMGHRKT